MNSIVDFTTFCTSIVALNGSDYVAHVRNYDFDFPHDMQQLLYTARFLNNSEVVATSVNIAGFSGVYTTLKPHKFSILYNVRLRKEYITDLLDS